MNWHAAEGQWAQVKGPVRKKWEKVADTILDTIASRRDRLAGRNHDTYGVTRDQAELQATVFEQIRNGYQPKNSP